jgi:hypothetical protein
VLLGVAATSHRRRNPASLIWGVWEGFCLWFCFYVHAILGFSLLSLRFGPLDLVRVVLLETKDVFRV